VPPRSVSTSYGERNLVLPGDSNMLKVKRIDGLVVVGHASPGGLNKDNAAAFIEQVKKLSEDESVKSMVLNLSGLMFVASAFLGSLIGLYRRLKEREGRLALCGVAKRVKTVFEVTQLTKIFLFCDSEPEGIEALKSD